MKKHLLGIAIFSFIFFVAAFVGGLFVFSRMEEIPAPQNLREEKTHCIFGQERFETENDSTNVRQAVYKVKTQTLEIELSPSRNETFPILHLFIKDEKGVRLNDSIHTVRYFTDNDVTKASIQYAGLNKISAQTSMYLIDKYSELETIDYSVKFEADKAIPVTIDYGK